MSPPASRSRAGLDLLVTLLIPVLGRPRARSAVGYAYAVWTLLVHALRAQHGKAVLGLAWTLLVPLLFIAVYVPVIASSGISKEVERVLGAGAFGFAVYVVGGFVTWNAFSSAVQNGAASLVNNPSIVHHSPIPLSVLPLVKVLTSMVAWLTGMVFVLLFLAVAGDWPGYRVALLPVVGVLLLFFLHGLALLLSALSVFFQDVLQIVSTMLLVQFFAVPIIYLPSSLPAHLQPLMQANPLTPFLSLSHALVVPALPLSASDVSAAGAWSLGTYIVGRWVFDRLQASLPDYV